MKLQYTGHPIVDTGLAVMIARAKELEKELKVEVNKISDLTPEIIEKLIVTNKNWLSNANRKLNSYTMVFSSNGPLTNASSNPDLVIKNTQRKIGVIQKDIEEIIANLNVNKQEIAIKQEEIEIITDNKKIKSARKTIQEIEKKIKKYENDFQKKEESLKKAKEKLGEKESKKKNTEEDKGLDEYKKIIQDLVNDIKSLEDDRMKCEITGLYPASKVIEENGKKLSKEWFPLFGSVQDAQTYPSSSRTFRASAIALLASQFLPIGVGIIGNRLVCFQSNDYASEGIPLFQSLVEQIYKDTIKKTQILDKVETWGKGNAYNNITLLLLNYLTKVEEEKQEIDFKHLCLNLWLFSNSGQEPALEIYELPSTTLQFLWKVWRGIHRAEIESYIRAEKDVKYSLLECIKDKKEYFPFYPTDKEVTVEFKEFLPDKNFIKIIEEFGEKLSYKKKENTLTLKQPLTTEEISKLYRLYDTNLPYQTAIRKLLHLQSQSASVELFELYNQQILGYTEDALIIARWIAQKLTEREKNIHTWKKKVEFNKLKEFMIDVIPDEFTYEHYLKIFPCSIHPLKLDDKIKNINHKIIRYYLYQTELLKIELPMLKDQSFAHPKYLKIKSFAKDFFDSYIDEEGKDRFKRRILNVFSNNQIKPRDIENWFASLAESGKKNYTNEEWDDLCRNEDGENDVWEVMFQLRLELASLYHQKYSAKN
ncbi:hypothetical protein [Agriterribacter sp.]|uniref:hypothetical protein n=1 Tax=Agriterribacter sp. TaxID=2821509 RepID=UPI002CD6CD22|nr:hypothetical protein [Agriterribacter sp.]HTN08482.1 hypothetical protein [Agriterribacter sp.]